MSKKLLLVFVIITYLVGCDRGLSDEEFFEICPYERKYNIRAHYLKVPVTITPHQKVYKVGDTMTVSSTYSDEIYDLNMQTHFKITDFPFEPINLLYKFTEEGFEHGYRINELIVDDKFNTRYVTQSRFSDDFRGFSIYENGMYHYKYKIVFQTPGIYTTVMEDKIEGFTKDEIQDRHKELLTTIDFKDYCGDEDGNLTISVKTVIQGDPHYEDYIDQLVHLDKVIYRDNFKRVEGIDNDKFGNGSLAIDWSGIFLFEVVE